MISLPDLNIHDGVGLDTLLTPPAPLIPSAPAIWSWRDSAFESSISI